MFKRIAFFALFLAVTGLFAATSVNAQRLVKGSLVKSTDTKVETLIEPEANPAFDPAQCANGGIGSPVQSCGTVGGNNWDTGNMNGSKAHYAEGTSIHYRYVFTNLTVGQQYTIRLGYDAFKAPTEHAIDYLNTYDAGIDQTPGSVYQVIPCGGVAGCDSFTPDTINIPDDPGLDNYTTSAGAEGIEPPFVDGDRVFTGWGLTFDSTFFVFPYNAANAERIISVTFTANSTTAVMAWSGHIASTSEWNAFLGGAHGGAGTVSGSPYHMRNAGNGSFGDGQRELQLAASAVVTVPSAAGVNITGRVTDAYGRAISSAKMTLFGGTGEARVVYTNTFGYYSFKDVEVGDFYVMSAEHRRYLFVTGSVSFSLQDNLEGVNFQASR